ncbi:MAG: pantoate--beta-alanine ligase [Proteobacteria bacterium]|nr:pantoate--beta-alanine ligase [Pseudomonadota bacterium]
MQIVKDQAGLSAAIAGWHKEKPAIGFVPTMGALHEGHMALVGRARQENTRVVASLFVNPAQFGPKEDLSRYPRTPREDEKQLCAAGVDLLYMPSVEDMYPDGVNATRHVESIGDHLEGVFRPGHFDGVATVVARLLQRVKPTRAYFGEKDWQQLQVVKRLARDMNLPVEIIGVPTMREVDGLALSSRNRYLSVEERQKAALVPAVLKTCAEKIRRDPSQIEAALIEGCKKLAAAGFRLDYLECAEAESCAPVRHLNKPARVFVAAHLGGTRLIDNTEISNQ